MFVETYSWDQVPAGPEAELERMFIDEFLAEKGHRLEELHLLPSEEARVLMRGACLYAALKLAEVEARSAFLRAIELPV